jgi:hypothetical protein
MKLTLTIAVALAAAIALVASGCTVSTGGGGPTPAVTVTASPTPTASFNVEQTASPTPTPTPVPAATLSPAIAQFVALVARADRDLLKAEALHSDASIYSNLLAAKTVLEAAIEPANDGSQQFRLADKYGVDLRITTHWLVASWNAACHGSRFSHRDYLAACTWERRAQSVLRAYKALAQQLKAQAAPPSPGATASPAEWEGSKVSS